MSSPKPPVGGSAGQVAGAASGNPVEPPVEINGSSRGRAGAAEALERDVEVEGDGRDEAQMVGGPVAETPQVAAVETAQQSPAQAAGKTPQMVQAYWGKVAAALAVVLLVLWFRRLRSQRSSATGDGVAAVDHQPRRVVAEVASAGTAHDRAQKAGDPVAAKAQAYAQAREKAQQARVQAMEKAQQARAQAVEKARQLREQAVGTAQAAEKAQQVAQEAQRLVHALGQRLPHR